MKKSLFITYLLALTLIMSACHEKNAPSVNSNLDSSNSETAWVRADPSNIAFHGRYAASKEIVVTSNCDWSVEVQDQGMNPNINNYYGHGRGTIKVSVQKLDYETFNKKSCDLIIRAMDGTGHTFVRVTMGRWDH